MTETISGNIENKNDAMELVRRFATIVGDELAGGFGRPMHVKVEIEVKDVDGEVAE